MNNTKSKPRLNFIVPAAQLTKLEAVAVELYARNVEVDDDPPVQETVAHWAIGAAKILLLALEADMTGRTIDPAWEEDTNKKIVFHIERLQYTPKYVTHLVQYRYLVNQLCELTPDQKSDLANYLEGL